MMLFLTTCRQVWQLISLNDAYSLWRYFWRQCSAIGCQANFLRPWKAHIPESQSRNLANLVLQPAALHALCVAVRAAARAGQAGADARVTGHLAPGHGAGRRAGAG